MHSLWCARDRMRDHNGYRPPEIMDRNVRPCYKGRDVRITAPREPAEHAYLEGNSFHREPKI